jgi:quercetin dioxygenase-like cupin family protein
MPAERSAAMQAHVRFRHHDAELCVVDSGRLRGLRHRTVIDGRRGSAALALWHEEHLPGFLVPPHRHDCEEIITVIRGEIIALVGGFNATVRADESILIPAGELHGFEVVSREPVKLVALFASSNPRVFREDGTEAPPPWEGGNADQFGKPGDSRR